MGKTRVRVIWLDSATVHPHRCGENDLQDGTVSTRQGSPPQVWGKRPDRKTGIPVKRFTPTGVGKTCGRIVVAAPFKVHPHRCGENYMPAICVAGECGSPPQVWGKLASAVSPASRGRFTPTGVGKTPSTGDLTAPFTVHPHRCGENRLGLDEGQGPRGSPPQVWGKHIAANRLCQSNGFTPTGVGKTPRTSV